MTVVNTHSLELDGTADQRAKITDAAQTGLDVTGALTVELWVHPLSWPANAAAMVSKFSLAGGNRSYRLTVAADSVAIQVSADGSAISSAYYLLAIADGVWTHVAAVFDPAGGAGLANRFRLYVNGVELTPLEISGSDVTTIFDGAEDFFVGANAVGFDGYIDDVRVWSVARSGAQIAADRSHDLVGTEAGLVGYWRFDDDLTDSTANGNDLTDVAGTAFNTEVPFFYPPPRTDIAGMQAPDPPGGIGLLVESREPRIVVIGDASGGAGTRQLGG